MVHRSFFHSIICLLFLFFSPSVSIALILIFSCCRPATSFHALQVSQPLSVPVPLLPAAGMKSCSAGIVQIPPRSLCPPCARHSVTSIWAHRRASAPPRTPDSRLVTHGGQCGQCAHAHTHTPPQQTGRTHLCAH